MDQPPAPSHLTLSDLGVRRNDRWLFRNLTLKVPRGKFVAVVGPSGVGKSSLLNCLAGILRPSEGEVKYCCQQGCTHEAGEFQKRIGIIFQNLFLANNNSVLRNVLCGKLGHYHWWQTLAGFPAKDQEEAYRIAVDLGLGGYIHTPVANLSGGEQQRTAIARALFQGPEVVLADEPVSNLDVYLSGRVLGILRLHAHEAKRTIICVLHDPHLVERFADFVLSLNPGEPTGWRLREITRTA